MDSAFFWFNLQIFLVTIIVAMVSKIYIWPKLKSIPTTKAVLPLLLIASARILGTTFLVPNLNYDLPYIFATRAGYGDLISGVISLLAAIVILKNIRLGIILTWIAVIIGTLDFAYVIYLATALNIYANVGVSWLIMVIIGPINISVLFMFWKLLLKKEVIS